MGGDPRAERDNQDLWATTGIDDTGDVHSVRDEQLRREMFETLEVWAGSLAKVFNARGVAASFAFAGGSWRRDAAVTLVPVETSDFPCEIPAG